ncbi:MAG: SpoIIE family protein phosphatase [Firmicutes bacterium]|nr:SpoIIE family protein phosphatase [Bacillota bacterium]
MTLPEKIILRKKIQTTLLSAILFFVITLLFRQFFNILSVMGIRPSALPPVLGLMFGPFAVLGCAIGNFIADIVSGYSLLISVLGFVAQFIYGLLPYLMWRTVDELRNRPSHPVRLNKSKYVLRYILIVIINAIITSAFLGSIKQSISISSLISTATLMLLLNNFVFCIVLGIPMLIIINMKNLKANRLSLSMNERLVLVFLVSGIISGVLIGVFAVVELTYAITDPVAMWMRIYMYIAVNLLGFYMIAVVFLWYCEKNITVPVEAITNIAKSFVGDGQEKKDSSSIIAECERLITGKENSLSEAGILAQAFKKMTHDIDDYIRHLTAVMSENERIATELNVASQIQADMLPKIFPAFPGRDEFEVFAIMQPAKEVGGDFYDFFLIDDDHLCIAIGDVSGKGISAALFMVIAKTLINNRARSGEEPKVVFTNVNNQLCEGNENAMFVTAWIGVFEISSGKLTYVNAGHNPPLIKKANGSCEYFQVQKSIVLAMINGVQYRQAEIQLNCGDTLYLYTDGVTEAHNVAGELYGQERLITAIDNIPDLVTKDILDYIKSDVDNFAAGVPQFDDIAMLMLSVK